MKEASEMMDIFKPKNWWRYFKEGVVLSILFGIVITIINVIMDAVATAFGINLANGYMASLQVGGMAIAVTLLVGLVVQNTVGGFLIEYINNSKAKLMRWIRR